MSKQKRLLPPLSKDHPIFKRGYTVGLETIISGSHNRSPSANIERSTLDLECPIREPETKKDP
jgi:hypothetical protein